MIGPSGTAGGTVRSEQRLAVTIAALIFGPVFMLGPLAGGCLLIAHNPWSTTGFLGLACCTASGFFASHMLPSLHWIELDGEVIRGRRFWTRQLIEHRVQDIAVIVPLAAVFKDELGNKLADVIYQTSNRGWEIRFQHGQSMALIRGDMIQIDEFMLALKGRWHQSQENIL